MTHLTLTFTFFYRHSLKGVSCKVVSNVSCVKGLGLTTLAQQ